MTPNSYKDPFWTQLASNTESKLDLPSGLLQSILLNGEKTNADRVSKAGAKTPFQIIPATRDAAIKQYGIDPYLSPENAAEVAGRLLQDSIKRNKGDVQSAVAEYHGGTDRKNWGPITQDYVQRVTAPLQPEESTYAKLTKPAQTSPTIAQVFDAYKSGKLPAKESADFEADVKAGKIMLPQGAMLKGQQPAGPKVLPQELAEAYASNQLPPNVRADLERDMNDGIVTLPPTRSAMIPGIGDNWQAPTSTPVQAPPVQAKEPTLAEKLQAGAEADLSLATGLIGGGLGMAGGAIEGIGRSIFDGTFGTQQGVNQAAELAQKRAGQLTYQPRTPLGQEYTQMAGEAMQNLLPIAPMAGEIGAITEGIKPASIASEQVARNVASKTGKVAAEAIQRSKQAITPSGQGGSVGAAAVPVDTMRVTKAESLPVPVELTRGAASRDAAQLAFEKEQMKGQLGAPLRQRAEENNLQALQNFDALIDATAAETPDLAAAGNKVISALSEGYKQAKNKVNVLYKKAEKSPESQAQVDVTMPVAIGEGENAINGSLIDYINNRTAGVEPTIANAAKKQLIRFGIAEEDANGNLIGKPATVKQLEDFRSEMSGAADPSIPRQLRDETIIKKLTDATTEPVAGDLYRAARSERAAMARKFENRAVVARLLTNKRGMDDPAVAVDQVFQRSVLNGAPEEITFLKRVLNTSGEEGRQAWRELQGATMKHIKDEATKGMGMDSADRPIVSPAKLNQVVNTLDKNGRLDIVLGKKNAEIVRDLNDVVKYVNTTPPGTLINNSGTVGTLLAAMGEAGATGALTGLPVPAISILRALNKQITNRKISAKIQHALNAKSQKF